MLVQNDVAAMTHLLVLLMTLLVCNGDPVTPIERTTNNTTSSTNDIYVFEIKGKPDHGYYISLQLGEP